MLGPGICARFAVCLDAIYFEFFAATFNARSFVARRHWRYRGNLFLFPRIFSFAGTRVGQPRARAKATSAKHNDIRDHHFLNPVQQHPETGLAQRSHPSERK
jgi:hypothetical protein